MDIYIQNTLSGKKELFTAVIPGKVGMYNCGPTVYDYAHIGNLRSYVFADTLRRMFEYNGYTVDQIVNITDVGHLTTEGDDGEDKMSKALRREGKPMTMNAMREIADFYFEKFKDDLGVLNIELPTHFPFASDHITEDIGLISTLTEKGFTYSTSDGIYFDTSKYPEYGKLARLAVADTAEQSRIGLNPEKKNPRDFALWKFNIESGYEASFGKGFPGWHIECSAMSVKYLGPEFDLHTGGIDHIPVHHTNEIAQAVCAGYPFAHYWMHNNFLNMGTEKMAKSGDGFITLQTLINKNISPLALRYFYLTAHYSSLLSFSFEALEGAQTAWKRLKKAIQNSTEGGATEEGKIEQYTTAFHQFVNDDIDTPKALALVWELVKDETVSVSDKRALVFKFDAVLGLKLDEPEIVTEIPFEVQKLAEERDRARAEKDWEKSDQLRSEIEKLGYMVKDGLNGTEIDIIS